MASDGNIGVHVFGSLHPVRIVPDGTIADTILVPSYNLGASETMAQTGDPVYVIPG